MIHTEDESLDLSKSDISTQLQPFREALEDILINVYVSMETKTRVVKFITNICGIERK